MNITFDEENSDDILYTFEVEIEDHDDTWLWSEVEQCEWCGKELPPIYTEEDDFECSCGHERNIPSWLVERMEEESFGTPDRNAAGQLDWGPPGRYRPFPARSGYPYDHWRGHEFSNTNESVRGVWHLFDK